MPATFSSIPANLRVPGIFVEFDPSRANSGQQQFKLLVLGQRLTSGTVQAATPVLVSRKSAANLFFGQGSQLAEMLGVILDARPAAELWAIALDDLVGGNAATANIVFTGAASVAGTLRLEIGEAVVRVGVNLAQTAASIASACVAAINARTDLTVTSAVNGGITNRIDLTARNKGTAANDVQIQVFFEADSQPSAPTIAITGFSGGTGNPDIANAIAVMGDTWYNWIVTPWTDSANMTVLATELDSRFSALRQIGARAFCAFRGTYGTTAAYGVAHNPQHFTCMGTSLSQTPPHIWAAVNACIASNSLINDPSRQLRTLVLPGIAPPDVEDRFDLSERGNLLYEGISTYTVDAGGQVRIESQITMYQKDALGNADDSMLYINTPETFEAYRAALITLFAPHAQDKLADDGNNIPSGQPIMTPKKARAMLHDFYRGMIEQKGWCEDLASYTASLIVEKQGNRLAIVDQPNFIDNLRQIFARSELVN